MWILTTIIAALVVLFISMDASWSNVLSASRNELVFENRVKEYGAFKLRKEEPRNLFVALFLGVGLVLLGAFGLSIATKAVSVGVQSDILTEWPSLPPLPAIEDNTQKDDRVEDNTNDEQEQGTATAGAQQDDTTPLVVEDAATLNDTPDEPAEPLLVGGGGLFLGESLGGNGTKGEGKGQGSTVIPPVAPVDVAEFMPEFPGGDAALMAFMQKHISLSERDKENRVRGTLWITFVVRKSGEITDVKVLRGIAQKTDVEESAVRTVARMPRWTPGRMGQTPVDVRMTMPVRVEVRY